MHGWGPGHGACNFTHGGAGRIPGLPSVSALELRGVVKHFRGGGQTVRAVDGVTLTITSGRDCRPLRPERVR